jgi:hypothetical protein
MVTAQVAEQRGVPPSELFGITCEFCAYCFDEALIVRRSALAEKERRDAENVNRTEGNRDHLRNTLKSVPGV